jgi:hypothetical protein
MLCNSEGKKQYLDYVEWYNLYYDPELNNLSLVSETESGRVANEYKKIFIGMSSLYHIE